MSAKYFAFDVETTGLSPENSEIISLAAVLLDANLKEIATLEVHALPDNGCPEEAARINGYDEEKWKSRGALSQQDLYKKVSTFVDDCWRLICVGHNVSFDIGFLKTLFLRYSTPEIYNKYFSYHSIDTLGCSIMFDIAKFGKKGGGYNLTDLTSRYQIDLGEDAHDARADINATISLFKHLIMAIRGDAEVVAPVEKENPRNKPFMVKQGESYVFNRGKFFGKSPKAVASVEKSYLEWVLRDIGDLDEEMKKSIAEAL